MQSPHGSSSSSSSSSRAGTSAPAAAGIGCAMAQALSVADAFDGRSVLITGATGYVGSLVLEQLLRVCPGVDRRVTFTASGMLKRRGATAWQEDNMPHRSFQKRHVITTRTIQRDSSRTSMCSCCGTALSILAVLTVAAQLPPGPPGPCADRKGLSLPRCRVYVLVRGKQGRPPPQRLQRLLDGGLFHLLWDQPGVLDKVHLDS